jgi:site-specific recombinase XerD
MRLVKKPKSPYWYLRQQMEDGRWRDQSIGLRWDSQRQTRQAEALLAKLRVRANHFADDGQSGWDSWVHEFLRASYTNPNSYRRYLRIWIEFREWLVMQRLPTPRHVEYRHAQQFFEHRHRSVSRNTARLETKWVMTLLSEAVRRGHCSGNPWREWRCAKNPPKPKRELSEAELRRIEEVLPKYPPWMKTVFLIMRDTGCRFSEAVIADLPSRLHGDLLELVDAKRQPASDKKRFWVPMTPVLRQHLEELARAGVTRTAPEGRAANVAFNNMLRRALPGVSSHCLRVTFITRCHRAGLSESQAMLLVNHSSRAVHQVYCKLNALDARQAAAKMLHLFAPPKIDESS